MTITRFRIALSSLLHAWPANSRLAARRLLAYFPDMANKTKVAKAPKPVPVQRPPGRRGRPPGEPKTHFARWLRDKDWTVKRCTEEMRKVVTAVGLTPDAVPQPKALLDAVNGRHWPAPATMLILQYLTDGQVDLVHWVRDLYADP